MESDREISADAAIIAVRSHKIGETVPVEICRGEDRLTINVLGSDETLSSMKEEEKNSRIIKSDTDDKQEDRTENDDSYRYYRQQRISGLEFWDYFTNPLRR